ncbi:MAG: FecCD family ABC transporter permease [Streptosporangiaceae bacterium]
MRGRGRTAWLCAGAGAVVLAGLAGVTLGAVSLPPLGVAEALADHLPGVHDLSRLDPREAAIVWEIRLPRVVLGLLVGGTLSLAGGCYQGVFRNPLADPYLLGVAAGAGLGATVGIVTGVRGIAALPAPLPLFAFAGAVIAVALTYAVGTTGASRRTPAGLILAGVAVASFLTALQTYLQQRHTDQIEAVFTWILGSLATAGWRDVTLLAPYTAVTAAVAFAYGRTLDVMSVGDDEATSLGLHPQRVRLILVVVASLGTAAAVAVSGLIGFVGLIVPHAARLACGPSYRMILPMSLLFGGAFLALADLLGRVALAPAEVPIGVVTAFFGAPFFVAILRTSSRRTA